MARIPGVGDLLGPYRITRELGAGGMGVVFEAVEEGLGRRVALKVLAIQLAEEPEFRARFQREATVLARSDSPHIIQVYSHGEHDGCLYLATQFVPGGDLAARVAREGVPTPEDAVDIAAQVASALADAHAVGVVHRDVKPHNVLLRPSQDHVHAYLCDFGIARDDESSLTSSGVVAGTYAYLAPERFRGEPATPASDVYALGCLLWFLLAGQLPYAGGIVQLAHQHEFSAIPQLPGASDQLNGFLRRAMAKDPAARHPSAASAAAELRAIRSAGLAPGQRVAAPPPPPPPPSFGSAPSASSASSGSSVPPVSPVPPPYQPAPSTHSVPQVTPLMVDEQEHARRRAFPALLAVLLVLLLAGGGVALWRLARDEGGGAATDRPPTQDPRDNSSTPESGPVGGPLAPSDTDGDGDDDTILVDEVDDETLVLRSDDGDPSGFGALEPWAGTAYGSSKLVRGDFTGDGLADLALVETDRVRVARSTGAEFAAPRDWGVLTLPGEFRVTAGDFDADGSDDLAFLTGAGTGATRIDVARVRDGRFEEPASWAGLDGGSFADSRIGAADVDGDGRADFVEMGRRAEGGVEARVFGSRGDGFDVPELWFEDPDWELTGLRPLLADVDADSDADLVLLRDVGHLEVATLLSDGRSAFDAEDALAVDDLVLDQTRAVPADTDGDGATDLVLADRATNQVRRLAWDGGFAETGRVTVDANVGADGSILVSSAR